MSRNIATMAKMEHRGKMLSFDLEENMTDIKILSMEVLRHSVIYIEKQK